MLGGEISVVSEVGRGSTFTVSLPLEEIGASDLVPADTISRSDRIPSAQVSLERLAGCRVLVAEDSRSLQFMIEHMLRPAVEQVTIVEDGQAALDEVQRTADTEQAYHLLLMDMQMPILNGYQATERLRELGYQLPIVALTAGAMAGDADRCYAAGCSDYLAKPFEYEQLLAVIAMHYKDGQNN